MKKISILLFAICFGFTSFAQTKVYPSNWWINMADKKVQLLLHGNNLDTANITLNYPGIKLLAKHSFANKNYAALDIEITDPTVPGTSQILIRNGKKIERVPFPIKPRRMGNGTSFAQGVTCSDIMYLIMPDRFSNGDPTNDRVKGMKDQSLRRDTVFNRHGGDLKGVQNKIDYLKDLGVSSIWLNPVWENDMPNRTEHGYAFTDHYTVDPRLGGNAAYKNLSDALHSKGMKLIQDAVYNHIGLQHFLFQDQPDSTWFHRWNNFTQTSYKDQVAFDPYIDSASKKVFFDGWFVREMPDWDQSNPFVQNFLIQHALWSVEEFGVDGFRIDTYAYNDLEFMNRCNKALYDEYPKLTIFGETWVHGVPNQAYFSENNFNIPFKSNLQATTDFQLLFYGITPALQENFGWTDGVNKLYTNTAYDFMYKDPMRQVIFLDNHDINRYYSHLNEDTAKYKVALSWLFTFRGIPQMYYGNEILMTGLTSPNDGYVRQDFPGGWAGDKDNKFTEAGRSAKENDVFNHIKKLTSFRNNSSAIKTGKFMHYLPQDGLYVYFRYDSAQTVMCVMNTDEKPRIIDFANYAERTKGFSTATNIQNGAVVKSGFTIPAKQMWVLEMKQ